MPLGTFTFHPTLSSSAFYHSILRVALFYSFGHTKIPSRKIPFSACARSFIACNLQSFCTAGRIAFC
jgi:hypothetical protein